MQTMDALGTNLARSYELISKQIDGRVGSFASKKQNRCIVN